MTAKRVLDVAGAGLGLLFLSPVMALVTGLVWIRMGRPVLFRQTRPGLHGRPFTLYKFRTMREAVDGNGNPLPDRERLTPLGQALRKTSLDELPELWNVLKGDMSLVGPRPLLMKYLPLYTPRQARRHDVRPGMTGWAQVNGRNAIGWTRTFEMDAWYVNNRSLLLDLRILLLTLKKVVLREGIGPEGKTTREEFRGVSL